jgi:hypothetical protein
LSWILEDNLPMRRILERLGARAYKTYRVFGKKLALAGEALAAQTSSPNHPIKLAQQAQV